MAAFAEATRWLKSRYPRLRVTVRRCRVPDGSIGDTTRLARDQYRIRVSSTLDEDAAVHILIHEWAHAAKWGPRSKRMHMARWAVEFAELLDEWGKICASER